MRIIDAHHHFWDLSANRHPWLQSEKPAPFRYGDTTPLRRDFMPDDLRALALAAGLELVGTVSMEGETDPATPIREAQWMTTVAGRHGLPNAHAAQAWLDRDDIETVLSQTASIAMVRSIRHKPRAHPAPGRENEPLAGSMNCPRWRAGYDRLAASRLHFELQTPWWHLRDALPLAERHPHTRIIVNHCGLPSDRSEQGLAGWHAALAALVPAPNIVMKISGLGVLRADGRAHWPEAENVTIVRRTIDLFGPDRVMFASNFPVDGLAADYATVWRTFDTATRDFDARERSAMFGGTACRCYGLQDLAERFAAT